MDLDGISTGLAILGASELSKDAVQRMLAPTADYVGSGILSGTKASTNLARILLRTARKINDKDHPNGRLPPRAMKMILDEGPFCEDELTAEYLSGILASSWTEHDRDDRSVSHLKVIQGLSTYAIRTHYIMYSALHKSIERHGTNPYVLKESNIGILMTWTQYNELMALEEDEDASTVAAHSFVSIDRLDLGEISAGTKKYLASTGTSFTRHSGKHYKLTREGGIFFQPGRLGVELFLWANGKGEYAIWDFYEDPKLEFLPVLEVAPLPILRKIQKE